MSNGKPFAFGAGQGTTPSFTFVGGGGTGFGKAFPGVGAGQQPGFGVGQPSQMGQQSSQPGGTPVPSLFGQQSTLAQNPRPPGVAATPQGPQGSIFGQGANIFGPGSAPKPGQPGGGNLFNIGTQPSSGLGGHQSGTMGQAVPSIFPSSSGQTGTTGPQMSQPTTQPQVLNMFSQFQSTPTPAPAPLPASVPGPQKSGGLGFFSQSPGQPQSFANPPQAQGGMQMGAGTQPQSMLRPPTGLQQSQLFPTNPQKPPTIPSQMFQPPQATQPSQLGQVFSTPQKPLGMPQPLDSGQVSQPIMPGVSTNNAQPLPSFPQQTQFFTTPQKQPVMTSSQFATPQTQGLLAPPQPPSQSITPNVAAPQPQAPAHLASQSSGQPAVFQLHSSPSTALPTTAVPPSTTPSSVPATSHPVHTSAHPLPQSQPQTTLNLQPQLKQPPSVAPAPATVPTTRISTTAATTIATTAAALPIISTSTTSSVTQTPAKKYTYRQLEDVINQWVLELGEQQKVFVNQAKQVNAWDVALLENEDSIISLHNEVERAKNDQDRLNHDLDSILAQQSELEEMLRPLEGFLDLQTVHGSTQHADQERSKTYVMAERIDTSMKDMMQNLREVMEKINTVNSANYDRSNPISQITNILNAHMDSLLFIDENTNTLQEKVDELSKKLDSKKQDQETKLRSAFS